jgi:hypothetical protein
VLCSAHRRLARIGVPRCHRSHGWLKVLPHRYGRTAVSSPGGRYHLHTFHLRFFLSLKPQPWTICAATHEPCAQQTCALSGKRFAVDAQHSLSKVPSARNADCVGSTLV